jgi:hypothetical protein
MFLSFFDCGRWLGITNKQYILDFPLFKDFHSYNLYSVGVVLVRSAPTTFHIVDVDDFTSIHFILRHHILKHYFCSTRKYFFHIFNNQFQYLIVG